MNGGGGGSARGERWCTTRWSLMGAWRDVQRWGGVATAARRLNDHCRSMPCDSVRPTSMFWKKEGRDIEHCELSESLMRLIWVLSTRSNEAPRERIVTSELSEVM